MESLGDPDWKKVHEGMDLKVFSKTKPQERANFSYIWILLRSKENQAEGVYVFSEDYFA